MSIYRTVNRIVIHCSATPNGKPMFRYAPDANGKKGKLLKTPIEVIDEWHAARGFKRSPAFLKRQNTRLPHVGYHFVIYTNGTIVTGRHLEEAGAHAKGYNLNSIGICMIGTDKYTNAQWRALAANVKSLLTLYPDAKVCGHRDLSPDIDGDGTVEPREWLKTCPGFDVRAWGKRNYEPLPENFYSEIAEVKP